MPKYRPKGPDHDSEYESDGQTQYLPKEKLGSGTFAQARLFASKTKSDEAVVVLNPVDNKPINPKEVETKQQFFKTLYPEKQSYLFNKDTSDYRLVLPVIPGVPYNTLKLDDSTLQLRLFGSAVQALQDCHAKERIVVDLKADNLLYHADTQKSYLIDGGHSTCQGEEIDSLLFQKLNFIEVVKSKQRYRHIAPECWSVQPNHALAKPAIDVYALGAMMKHLLRHPPTEIVELIEKCIKQAPEQRITLEKLALDIDKIKQLRRLTDGPVVTPPLRASYLGREPAFAHRIDH